MKEGTATLLTRNVSFDSPVDPTSFDYAATLSQALDSSDGHAPDLIVNKTLASAAVALVKRYDQMPNATVPMFEDASFRRNTLLAALGTAGDGQIGISNIAYEAGDSGT